MWNSNHESVDLLFWIWDSQICRTAFGHTRFICWTFHEKSDKFKFHCLILEGKSTRGLSKDGTCLSDVICISFDSLLTDILISSDIRQRWISGTVMAICRWMISCSPLPAHICLSTIFVRNSNLQIVSNSFVTLGARKKSWITVLATTIWTSCFKGWLWIVRWGSICCTVEYALLVTKWLPYKESAL